MIRKDNKDTTRINEQIKVAKVRVVDAEGEMAGVLPIADAIKMAKDAELDLVEVSPNADPPVCKILDYGKYKYQVQKRASEAKKKQKVISLKEIKLRPTIDTNDYNIKLRAARKFLESGDKVKFSLRFRGREMAHRQVGMDLMNKICEDLGEEVKVDQEPKMEGKQILLIVSPAKS